MNAENFELFERLEEVYIEPTINLRYVDDLLKLIFYAADGHSTIFVIISNINISASIIYTTKF